MSGRISGLLTHYLLDAVFMHSIRLVYAIFMPFWL